MLNSKEQVQQCLPIPLPKAKFKSPGNSDEKTYEDAPIATPSAGGPEDDDDPEVNSNLTQSLIDQIHALTTQFDTYWDEYQEHCVALSQDMEAIRVEMATINARQDLITQQLAELLSLYTPPPPPPPY